MNLELSKLTDVPTVLALLKQEVKQAEKAILSEGQKNMIPKLKHVVKEAIEIAENLDAFANEINQLKNRWDVLAVKLGKASDAALSIVRRAGVEVPTHKPEPLPNPKRPFPYADGKVAQAVFPVLQRDSRMTEKVVKALLRQESAAWFGTGGCPVLIPRTENPDETRDEHGHARYYENLPLSFFGNHYWLTSQFNRKGGLHCVPKWLQRLGFSLEEILAICQRRWGKP